jgi:hypothetical protein
MYVSPQIGMNPMGTPQFGILTYPYPQIWGVPISVGIDCSFFVFFSHAQDGLFSPNRRTQQKLQLSPFLMRGMRQGAPRSSRRARTPRCPPTRRKRRGRGFGRGVGGAGADWATCLSLLERAAATAADVAREGAASTAASSTRVGGGVSLRV